MLDHIFHAIYFSDWSFDVISLSDCNYDVISLFGCTFEVISPSHCNFDGISLFHYNFDVILLFDCKFNVILLLTVLLMSFTILTVIVMTFTILIVTVMSFAFWVQFWYHLPFWLFFWCHLQFWLYFKCYLHYSAVNPVTHFPLWRYKEKKTYTIKFDGSLYIYRFDRNYNNCCDYRCLKKCRTCNGNALKMRYIALIVDHKAIFAEKNRSGLLPLYKIVTFIEIVTTRNKCQIINNLYMKKMHKNNEIHWRKIYIDRWPNNNFCKYTRTHALTQTYHIWNMMKMGDKFLISYKCIHREIHCLRSYSWKQNFQNQTQEQAQIEKYIFAKVTMFKL